jgi:hypothetical protein
MTKHREILNLISEIRNSHSQMVNIFTLGSCLNFHLILRKIYPDAIPLYNIDHVITKIGGKCYDITGCVPCKGFFPFSECYRKKGIKRAFKQMYKSEYSIGDEIL